MKKSKRFSCSPSVINYFPSGYRPFPDRYRTKLHCDIVGNIAAGSASGSYQVFGNALSLPYDVTGGVSAQFPNILTKTTNTLQPTGFTNLCGNPAIYNRYRVLASKIDVMLTPENITDVVDVCLIPTIEGIAVPTVYVTAVTQAYGKNKTFLTNQQGRPLANYATTHKIYGISKHSVQNDDSYSAIYNANPAQTWYWSMLWATPAGVNLSSRVDYRVRVTFYCEMFSLEDLETEL